MDLNRIIVVLVVLITGIFFAAAGSFAEKPDKCSPWPACNDDSDPPSPPPECDDPSPSFAYIKRGGKQSADKTTYLASVDGCNHIPLPGVKGNNVHMTDILSDGSVNGVVIWDEDSSRANLEQMRRADFTVDSVGDLTHLYVDPDPLDLGDPGVPDGHNLLYSSGDVWGNSTHNELYLVLRRVYDDLDRGGTHTILIYDLNNLANNRELFRSEDNPNGWISNWDCPPGVSHPQAFAECYRPEALKWNPTGTAIYMRDTLRPSDTPEISSYWYAALRLKIPRGGPSTLISTWNWDISAPQIVFTGTATETAGDPGGIAVMPRPGVAGVSDLLFEDGSPGGILDVELCIGLFTPPLNDPDPEIGADHWVNCLIDNDPYTGLSYDLGNAGRGSWLSSNEILHNIREKRRLVSIFRTNIYDGVSTKIIDDAEDPDTGN